MFLCCMSLKTGVRVMGAINVFALLLLIILSIAKGKETDTLLVLLIYALVIFLPAVITAVILEVKGHEKYWRKVTMIIAWYLFSMSLIMNIIIIGYVILFQNCFDSNKES